MSNDTHPIKQPIHAIAFHIGNIDAEVGRYGVTRIEACEKPGEYCMIPYIRVWRGDLCSMEIPQHKLSYVQFAPESPPIPRQDAGGSPRQQTRDAAHAKEHGQHDRHAGTES